MRLSLIAACIIFLVAPPVGAATPNSHNALDCLFCHSEIPRWGVDTAASVEEAGFYRFEGDDPRLCYNCHKPEENLHPVEVVPGEGSLGTMRPSSLPLGKSADMKGKVVCTTCHYIHAANADAALLRGFAGSREPGTFRERRKFCHACHGEGLDRRSPHAGDDRACVFCHSSPPQEGAPVAVGAAGVTLCNFCHGALQAGHLENVNPFDGPVDCTICHDPHLGDESPGRLRAAYYDYLRGRVTVSPHNRRTLCSLCHVDLERYSLITKDPTTLCNRCHGTPKVVGDDHPVGAVPSGMPVPDGWPLRQGSMSCVTCHTVGHPDDEKSEKLLRGGPYDSLSDFCIRCHGTDDSEVANPHELVKELQGCTTCHASLPVFGKDTSQTVAFVASINMVCIRCHQESAHPNNIRHTRAVGDARAADIPDYFPLDRYNRITCATCHNPHLDSKTVLKLREVPEGAAICGVCHKL